MHYATTQRAICLALWVGWLPFLFSACQKEDAEYPSPTITALKIGSNDSKTAYTEHDLHLEALVEAPGKIAAINVQITRTVPGFGWTFTKTYSSGYAGLKNAEFHEHLDVPEDARVGDYELLLLVTDAQGKSTTTTGRFTIVRDSTLPTIAGLRIQLNTPPTGAELLMTGLVTAPNKIASIQVEVQSATWKKEFSLNDGDMVGQASYNLSKKFDISAAPKGHYHTYVNLKDQSGKAIGFDNHFDIN